MKALRIRLVVALGLVAIGLTTQTMLSQKLAAARDSSTSDLLKPLNEFPNNIGLWEGTDVQANPKIIADIKIDQHLNRAYVHPSGEKLVLWMSFSKRSLDQYHYPTVCMAGNGWTEDETARQQFDLAATESTAPATDISADSVPAMSMLFTKKQQSEMVYYWYYLIGEDEVDRIMRVSSQWARAFLRGRRNASLTIEVFSQSAHPDRRLLDEFARAVSQELKPWLPKGTVADCTLGANY